MSSGLSSLASLTISACLCFAWYQTGLVCVAAKQSQVSLKPHELEKSETRKALNDPVWVMCHSYSNHWSQGDVL